MNCYKVSISVSLWPRSRPDPWAPQVALVVKNLPADAGDIRDLGLIPGFERSPGERMATHSNILASRIPWREKPGSLQSTGSQRVRHDWSDLARWILNLWTISKVPHWKITDWFGWLESIVSGMDITNLVYHGMHCPTGFQPWLHPWLLPFSPSPIQSF